MDVAAPDYTPVSVHFIPEPLVTWMDLRGLRFEEPFFKETLRRAPKDRRMALTGLDELRAWDDRPTLSPSLFIFQVSRCGSTLLSQMLATLATSVVISEGSAVNDILSAGRAAVEQTELLRLVIRALGRNHGAAARRLIMKFTSWNVLAADAIHAAFPETPMIWLQRAPMNVVASHAEHAAGWMGWRDLGHPALAMFGLSGPEAQAMSLSRFRLHAIETLYRSASASKLPWLVLDHAELPDAVWERVARHAGLSFSPSEVEGMRARACFDGKTKDGTPFVARDRTPALSDEERRYVAERMEPLYRAIGHQKAEATERAHPRDDR